MSGLSPKRDCAVLKGLHPPTHPWIRVASSLLLYSYDEAQTSPRISNFFNIIHGFSYSYSSIFSGFESSQCSYHVLVWYLVPGISLRHYGRARSRRRAPARRGEAPLVLLRETIVNRTYGIHQNLYISLFLLISIWSYLLWSPVIQQYIRA